MQHSNLFVVSLDYECTFLQAEGNLMHIDNYQISLRLCAQSQETAGSNIRVT